jgi:hypothetical protein
MTHYESYFTDFTGNIFKFHMKENGYAKIPKDLYEYLDRYHNIQRKEFTPSLAFMYNECAFNLVEYTDLLSQDDPFFDNIYVVCPCFKEHVNAPLKMNIESFRCSFSRRDFIKV